MIYPYKIAFQVLECRMHKSLETLEKSRELAEVISKSLDAQVKICKRVDQDNRYQVIEMWRQGKKQKNLKGANL